jgi:cytochrome c oxidase assembly protein subunit 15
MPGRAQLSLTGLYAYIPRMPFDVRDFAGALPEDRAASRRNRRLVAQWLFGVAGMVLVMIVLGGVTRLTGSGLSIMEWAPFRGALPPMNDAEWQRLFQLYQQIPQYALVNESFGLAGFKQIFWLEWIHRLWGRLIGLAFLAPLVWFWATSRIERRLRAWLALLFLLGAMQGLVGWIMVASGFLPDSTAVSPYRLVIHLVLALVLYSALVWTGMTVLQQATARVADTGKLRALAVACSAMVVLTIATGGFVAGTHAGLDYNSFPLMDGRLVPEGYARLQPLLRNLTENIAAVQFDHRLLATVTALTAAATVAVGLAAPLPRIARLTVMALGATVGVQYILGVATLLLVVPVWLASAHQANAALVLTASLVLLHVLRPAPAARPRVSAA